MHEVLSALLGAVIFAFLAFVQFVQHALISILIRCRFASQRAKFESDNRYELEAITGSHTIF